MCYIACIWACKPQAVKFEHQKHICALPDTFDERPRCTPLTPQRCNPFSGRQLFLVIGLKIPYLLQLVMCCCFQGCPCHAQWLQKDHRLLALKSLAAKVAVAVAQEGEQYLCPNLAQKRHGTQDRRVEVGVAVDLLPVASHLQPERPLLLFESCTE